MSTSWGVDSSVQGVNSRTILSTGYQELTILCYNFLSNRQISHDMFSQMCQDHFHDLNKKGVVLKNNHALQALPGEVNLECCLKLIFFATFSAPKHFNCLRLLMLQHSWNTLKLIKWWNCCQSTGQSTSMKNQGRVGEMVIQPVSAWGFHPQIRM